jgi:hypothetical protein
VNGTPIGLRRCCRCDEHLPEDADHFRRDSTKRLGISYVCRPCDRTAARVWAAKHPDQMRAARARYKRNRADRVKTADAEYRQRMQVIIDSERTRCCACEATENIDLHHVDPAAKSFTVGCGSQAPSLAALHEELAKCVPLCRKCHRAAHKALRSGAAVSAAFGVRLV